MFIWDEPITVMHKKFNPSDDVNEHGNTMDDRREENFDEPVERKVIALNTLMANRPRPDTISPNFEARAERWYIMHVRDVSIYNKWDIVMLHDKALEVQGLPFNWEDWMPLPGYGNLVGGQIDLLEVV